MKNSVPILVILSCLLAIYFLTANHNKYTEIFYKERRHFVDLVDLGKGQHDLVSVNSSRELVSRWPLDFPVFRICTGDVNDDHSVDILVGVSKPTRYDPVIRKRLFIFKLVDGRIRPLWLGSQVAQPLVDFRFVQTANSAFIRTIEAERNGHCLVSEYKWKGFGLEWVRYLGRNLSPVNAYNQLNIQ